MRRHPFDLLSFSFGLLAAAIGLTFTFTSADLADLHLGWVVPIPLVVIGLAMLFGARRHERTEADGGD
jgi:uncharacterized membrane protein HdeD (DUF308 family)